MGTIKHSSEAAFKEVDLFLEQSYLQMERHLCDLLRYPSEYQPAVPGAPFGRPIADSLQYCLELAESFGFVTENLDGYIGIADFVGKSERQVGVFSHVDVVPAKTDGWFIWAI